MAVVERLEVNPLCDALLNVNKQVASMGIAVRAPLRVETQQTVDAQSKRDGPCGGTGVMQVMRAFRPGTRAAGRAAAPPSPPGTATQTT